MSYFLPKTAVEHLLASVVLAVKITEYLAAGLPVISNAYCGGASVIIEKNKLGVTYFPEDLCGISYDYIKMYLDRNIRGRCQQFALNNFGLRVNSYKYRDLYLSLM